MKLECYIFRYFAIRNRGITFYLKAHASASEFMLLNQLFPHNYGDAR